MSRIRRISPGLGRGGLLGNTEGPESYLRELDTLPSQFARATGGTETVISQGGKFYRVHTFTDTDPTSLLLNFDGANGSTTFTDDSGWGHAVTANGDAQISTTQSKFGGGSAAFDGTGDYLSVPDSPLFEFGSGDFTMECWFYIAGNSSQNNDGNRSADLMSKLPASGSIDGFGFVIVGDSTTTGTGLTFQGYSSTTAFLNVVYSGAITQSAWHHAAVCRSGSNLYLFLDGSEVGLQTGVSGGFPDSGHILSIGKGQYSGYAHQLNGYIDSLRITKGQALYTSAFTPPTTALTRVGSGSLAFTRGGSVEYLVVGGGGGGGFDVGGGGGAGGFVAGSGVVSQGQQLVGVGAGGAQKTSAGAGNDGSNSVFRSVVAYGGGGGGSFNTAGSRISGRSGGSGGGGTVDSTGGASGASGGSGTSPQGHDGATPDGTPHGTAGGGGGASETPASDGSGGDGIQSSISGTASYYGGGGGAGDGNFGVSNDGPASGGLGGGGDGGNNSPVAATAGDANTGGGGGGGSGSGGGTPAIYGASGGSGIVIARYRITQAEYEAEAA